MFGWNQRRVRQLTPGEIWLFIVGRVLAAFGLGALGALYFPAMMVRAAVPSLLIGLLCLGLAGRGLFRGSAEPDDRPAA